MSLAAPRTVLSERLDRLVLLFGIHVVLGVLLSRSPALATLHALGVLALGLRWSQSRRTLPWAFYCLGYIACADVLWRMCSARVFWEYGKYAVVLLALAILFRYRRGSGLEVPAGLYFVLLLPSAVLTLEAMGISGDTREAISFNLSGPFALAVMVVLVSTWRERLPSLADLLAWMMMPVVSVLAIALVSTVTASELSFGSEANFTTSGGYGPNQVSAILGLGLLFAVLLALNVRNRTIRWFWLAVGCALGLQALLTFSRGGLFNALVALAFFLLHFLRNRRARRVAVGTLSVLLVAATFWLLPKLNAWTAGGLEQRFTEFDTTGRKSLAEADLQLFRDHPLLGVGPGLSKSSRTNVFRSNIAAHTEFTRALAEHGVLGLLALATLVFMAFRAYLQAPSALSKAWVAGLIAWSLAEMSHSAMRIATISFVFGLAMFPFHLRGLPNGAPARRLPRPPQVARRP